MLTRSSLHLCGHWSPRTLSRIEPIPDRGAQPSVRPLWDPACLTFVPGHLKTDVDSLALGPAPFILPLNLGGRRSHSCQLSGPGCLLSS